jgi:hypothetical protein
MTEIRQEGAMAGQTAPRVERRIRRAVLLTNGPVAEAVAAETWALSRSWLGTEPPLAIVRDALLPDAGSREAVPAVLDEAFLSLVSGTRIAALRDAGWGLARADEIQAWVLVDVGTSRAPSNGLGTLLPALAERAWQHLRVHLSWHALVLAEPAAEAQAAQWAIDLAAAGVENVCVDGPVDAARLYWEPPVWQGRAATALAALLWNEAGQFNSAGPASVEGRAPAWSIGAAAWVAPQAPIKAQVALRCARLSVARWLAHPDVPEASAADVPPWEVPGLAVTPEQHRFAAEASVPPEPAGQTWHQRRPDWHAVHGLVAELRAATEKRAAQAHTEQYNLRGAWLGSQVAAWETALAQLRCQRLAPTAGWPQLQLFGLELRGLVAQLQSACVLIEDWLEEAGRQFERAEAAALVATQDLTEVCAAFPAPTRAGLLATLTNLWRWPGLVWAYLVMLPHSAQSYLDAYAQQGQARRAEANVHALRQAYLAMAQITRDGLREVEALLGQAEEVAAELATLATRQDGAAHSLEPWDAGKLDRLAVRLLPEVRSDLLGVLAVPVPEGQSDASPDANSAAAAAERLLARVAADLQALDSWSAADCLIEALDDAGLMHWLRRQMEVATPLWPISAQEADTPLWLLTLLGAGLAGGADSPDAGRLEAAFHAMANHGTHSYAQARIVQSGVDAVLLLRAAPVQLETLFTTPKV